MTLRGERSFRRPASQQAGAYYLSDVLVGAVAGALTPRIR